MGKACRILLSSGIAPSNSTTLNLLQSKNPSCPHPMIPDIASNPVTLGPSFDILHIMRSFPKGTSAGPSGLSIQHLLDAASVPLQTSICDSLKGVVNNLASGFPGKQFLMSVPPSSLNCYHGYHGAMVLTPFCGIPWAQSAHSQLVSSIEADDDCINLSFNAWYLDDGILVRERSAVVRALHLIEELAPHLGLFINYPKCEVFSRNGISLFPASVKSSILPNLEILGAPIGDIVHCSRFFAEKHNNFKVLLRAISDVATVDLIESMLPFLSSACAEATANSLKFFDEEVRLCFSSCVAIDVPDTQWQQAQLSPKLGGLGLRSLSLHSCAAFISSVASLEMGNPDNTHLQQAILRFNARVSPQDSITMESVLNSPPQQKSLSQKLDSFAFHSLLSSASLVNKARMLSVSSPHASSWITAIPSTSLKLYLDSAEYQMAIRWWLGLNTSEASPCPFCPELVLDPLGHHAASCRHGGDVVTRHNRLRDIFVEFCRQAHLSTPLLHTLRAVINLLISGSAPLDVAIFLAGAKWHLFEPYQFGVAFPCGAEKIAHGLRTCIEQHWSENDFGVLKVDMTNAFNLVSRQAILSECAKHFPELLPWVSWCYGQHPLLWHHLGCLTSESGVQQGDPLGPLLFSLVLNILVMKVARDSACSNLPFHAWYLDDGVMAGPRSSLCRILSLLQEEGPALGIIVNLPKCEAFSRHGLDMFPLRMKKSDKPSLEILGIPIGDQEFCSSFISKKHTKAKILLSLLEEVGIVDPQVALILLRLCGAFCKLVHLARATPSTLTSKVFALIDDDIRMTFCRCIGVDMSDTAWQQAQLSSSRGGLGFRSLSRHSSAAFISSLCSSGFGLQSSHHLSQAIETFNSLVSPADAVSVETLLTSSVSQKYLSGKLDDRVFNMLLNSSSVADKARLLSVSSPHAASWLSVVPSENLGLHLDPPVFQVAIKWWLGLDTSEGSQCALCPGSTLDHLGHHAVTCKYGGDVVSRHNRIRDILVETCRRAHIGVKVEVGNNLSRDHSKTRPADILLPNWFLGRTAALDVSIPSPLNPVTLLEAGVLATAAAQATEARKHQANDPKCSELGWVCVPMVVETYGAWGKEATAIISSVASRLATSTCRPKSTILHEIYGRLNLNLVCANATAILSRIAPPP
eukprot:Em0005g992a